MTLPAFPSVSPDPEIAHNYASNLDLTLSPISSDGYDAYSISKLYDPSPTNAWVVANRIPAVNSPADGYVTGSLFVMPLSELPSIGSDTYYIYAYRFAEGGGDAQYYYSSSFTITRFTAPTFPDVSPDPTISSSYTGNLLLTLSPVASDGLDAYSISRLLDTTPTNQFVTDNRISPANTFLDYVTDSSFEMPATELPSAGSQYTYYIYAYRFPSGGGEGQYYYSDSFTIARQEAPTSGYGLEIYNSFGVLVLGQNDISALYKASYSGSVSTTTGQKTLTTDITATGVLTSDLAFIEELELNEIQKVSIPTNGVIRYTSTITDPTTPSAWTSIYKITVISKGDT